MAKAALRILVPLDGSAGAESILGAVLPLAQKTSLELTLLGVVPKDTSLRPTETYLAKAGKLLQTEGIDGTTKTCIGNPVAAILKHARPEKTDLLAMATHGRSGLKRVVMGSVAEEIVRRSEVPLLISRPGCRMEGWVHVVTLDGSPESEEVLDDIIPLTRLLGATLHLLHVGPAGADAALRPYLEQKAAQARARAVTTEVVLRRGVPARAIVRYAAGVRAGLVAMATHGRTGFRRAILGSVAEAVLRNVPCPVMLRRVSGSPRPPGPGAVFA